MKESIVIIIYYQKLGFVVKLSKWTWKSIDWFINIAFNTRWKFIDSWNTECINNEIFRCKNVILILKKVSREMLKIIRYKRLNPFSLNIS